MELGIKLDPKDGRPLYVQIFDAIAARIDDGVYPAGYRLPATRRLAEELETHRNTVVRAFEELVLAGYVTSVVGRGSFVAERAATAIPEHATRGGIAWASLASRVADAEPLRRLERLRRASTSHDVINLTRSQPSPDLLPHDLFKRCVDHVLRTDGTRAMGYAPREGVPKLREAVAEELRRRGVPIGPEDLVITSGSQQALDVVVRTLVDPDDTFLVEQATYTGMLNLLAAARAHVVGVPCDLDGPEPTALRRLVRGPVKGLYLIPNAQNPTGRTMPLSRRHELLEWSHETGVPLIEDDYAADLDLGASRAPVALRALDADVIHVGTLSKNLIPALRIGWVACPPVLRDTVVSMKAAMDLGTSGFLQCVAAEFLDRGYMRTHLAHTLPVYRKRRDALRDALVQMLPADIVVHAPDRGIAVWLDLPSDLDPERVYDAARREGVLVAPSTLHGVAHHNRGVRMTFCAEPIDRLVEGARRFAHAIEAVVRGGQSGRTGLDVV